MEEKQKGRNDKGITLVALVVTIVVLIILAGVSISAVLGENGIITIASKAKENMQIAVNEEQKLVNGKLNVKGIWYDTIDDYLNNKPSSSQNENAGEEDIEEEPIEETATIKVGDYVNYTPTSGTYTVATGTKGTGRSENQSFTTETGENELQWRVWSINEENGTIEIIASDIAQEDKKLIFGGEDGYNHGVDILNDLCETLYSKIEDGTKVATGRSLNVEDILEKTTINLLAQRNYGNVWESQYKNYPTLYAQELGSTQNGLDETADLIKRSDRVEVGTVNSSGVTEYTKYTGTSSTTGDLISTNTNFAFNPASYLADLGVNTVPESLFEVGGNYWLASRCVYGKDYGDGSMEVAFSLFGVGSEGFYVGGWESLYQSAGGKGAWSLAVRPVVSLHSTAKLIKDTVNSTQTVTYWNIEF